MKLPHLLLLAAAAWSVAAPAAAAAELPAARRESRGVGLYASNIAGSGATWQQDLGGGWGYHASFVGWGQAPQVLVNAGGALTREIDRREWGTLYGLLAAGTLVDGFFGGHGLPGGMSTQANVTPGLGVGVGPFIFEAGYSIYVNQGGPGFVPAGGAGMFWRF